MSRYGFERLLVRQLDVEADREPAALLRAAVRSLHHAAAAAGDDRPAALAEPPADRARRLVRLLSVATRAEPNSATAGRSISRDLLEARAELGGDLRDRRVDVERAGWSRIWRSSVTARCCGTCDATIPSDQHERRRRSRARRRRSPCRAAAEPEPARRAPDGAAVEDPERDQVEQVEEEAEVGEREQQVGALATCRPGSRRTRPTPPRIGPAIATRAVCHGLPRVYWT